MAEEYINGIVRDIQNMSAMGISNVTLKIETALALIAELEGVRAERDALRAALEAVRDIAANSQGEWSVGRAVDTPEWVWSFKNIVGVCEGTIAALNTQPPQAEWTPRDKQDVRVIDTAHSMSNRIGTVVDFNGAKAWVDFAYWVDSPVDGTHVYQLEVSQIAPAD